jgi:hypothetical protein
MAQVMSDPEGAIVGTEAPAYKMHYGGEFSGVIAPRRGQAEPVTTVRATAGSDS